MEEATYNSVTEASKRWKEEGLKYKNDLNDWLDIIYMDQENPTTPCPEETRKDMSDYIINTIGAYNEKEKFDELRELFPPDVEPLDNFQQMAWCVSQALLLEDGGIVVTINEWHQERLVYMLNGNNRECLEGSIFMTGKSFDKKYIAKVYPDKIDIHEGWYGEVINTFSPPTSYGEKFLKENTGFLDDLSEKDFDSMNIHQVVVFPKGDSIGIASRSGIFVLGINESQVIVTENNEFDDEDAGQYEVKLEYPHIDISPDGKYLVAGSQDALHSIFENKNNSWKLCTAVESFSAYPNFAKFNYKLEEDGNDKSGPQVLLSSCHMSRSSTISLPVKKITGDLNINREDDNIDDYLYLLDNQKWIFAVKPFSWGWALGSNDGYIWFKDYKGLQIGYLHVGLCVMDIDLSSDGKKMIVASYGQVIEYDCSDLFSTGGIFRVPEKREEKRKDPYAITSTAFVDKKRYLFLNTFSGVAIW